MARLYAEFAKPPLIETVVGVQFAQLSGLTSAHAGWFWKNWLDSSWEKIAETIPVPDQFERFETVALAAQRLTFDPLAKPTSRVQISQKNDARMIQIQPTRFHYNWNRVGGEYPRYKNVREEFDLQLATFCRFLSAAGLDQLVPNQWELTYINSIPPGPLWNAPTDWHRVLPLLFTPEQNGDPVRLDSFGGEWHFEIAPRLGRLHVAVQLATVGTDPTRVLLLQTTARGPVGKDGVATLGEGLDLGHQVAVDRFVKMTSAEAHRAWGRQA